jgi:hypothetical protein
MKTSLLKSLSPVLLLVPILAGGSAQAATGSCSLSNLAACNVTLDDVQFSNFSFTGFTAVAGDMFNIEGYPSGAGGVALSFSPNRVANTSGNFMYTATLLNGKTFNQAQANLTGSTLGGGSMNTTFSSAGLPTSATSTSGMGTTVGFNSGLTTQTFTQAFGFSFTAAPDNLTNVGATFTATTPSSTSVPGPVPFIGAVAAFGFSRKLRSRIRSAA